ncbi:MAG: hypothetical protein AAF171_16820 [Cyanobacteria bacterium P01_A01_bin.116]
MGIKPSSKILKRSGAILVAIGFIDLAILLYCTIGQIPYPSRFNLVAALAGVLLLGDNLRAATIVRWFAALGFGGVVAFIFAFPFIQPLDLTLTYLRLEPAAIVPSMVTAVLLVVVLFWLCCELGRKPVQAAMRAARVKPWDIGIAAVVGAVLVAGIAVAATLLLNSDDVAQVEALAQQRWGRDYSYHVSSLSATQGRRGTTIKGEITAWNDQEIRRIPINFQMP